MFVSRAAGALGIDGRLEARTGEQTGGELGGGLFLQVAEGVDGFQCGRVVAGEFLEIELGAEQCAQSRLIVDVVVAKDGVEIGLHFRSERVEGGVVSLDEIRSGTRDRIAEPWEVGLAGDFLFGRGLCVRDWRAEQGQGDE